MNFNIQRHLRLAGSVAAIVGVCLSNWQLVLFGWIFVLVGYMFAISKIEAHIEGQEKSREDEDAIH